MILSHVNYFFRPGNLEELGSKLDMMYMQDIFRNNLSILHLNLDLTP